MEHQFDINGMLFDGRILKVTNDELTAYVKLKGSRQLSWLLKTYLTDGPVKALSFVWGISHFECTSSGDCTLTLKIKE